MQCIGTRSRLVDDAGSESREWAGPASHGVRRNFGTRHGGLAKRLGLPIGAGGRANFGACPLTGAKYNNYWYFAET